MELQGTILFQYGAYAVVKSETDYKIWNIEQQMVEESTDKLFEAIRGAKLYDKFLEEAMAFEPPSFNKKKEGEASLLDALNAVN